MELALAVPVSMVTEKNQRTIQYTIHYIYQRSCSLIYLTAHTFFLLGRVGVISLSDKLLLFYDSNYYNQQSFYISDVKCHCLRSKENVSSIHSFLHDIQEENIIQRVTSIGGKLLSWDNCKIKNVDHNSIVECGMPVCTGRGACGREAAAQNKREQALYLELELDLKTISATFFLCYFNSVEPQLSFLKRDILSTLPGIQALNIY